MNPRPQLLRSVTALFFLTALIVVVISDAKESKSAEPESFIALPKFEVRGQLVCSFGISLVVMRDPKTKMITRLFISNVADGSGAADYGLKEGDEILRINGEKVAGMDGEAKPGKQLFDLLINQPAGKRIDIEVAVTQVKKMTLKSTPPWGP